MGLHRGRLFAMIGVRAAGGWALACPGL